MVKKHADRYYIAKLGLHVGEVGAKRAPGVKRATRISKNKRHSHERNYCELM